MVRVSLPQNCEALNLIDGRWTPSSTGSVCQLLSPYSGGSIGQVHLANSSEVTQCLEAAHRAHAGWRSTPIKERTQILFNFREKVLQNISTLANLVAAESGKTVEEARAGILKGIEVCEFALSLQNSPGQSMEVSRGVWCQSQREPLGVVVGVTPFNFPAMVPLWMYPIALTLGNCFVLKPSEKVPFTSTEIGRLLIEAGYPPGVFSILNGGPDVVQQLATHPLVEALAFVGSTPVARAVYTQATAAGKRALCLGGAKNCQIIVPDADPNLTVRAVVDSFTGCAGQRCMAASVLLAVGSVDHLIERIIAEARSRQLGEGIGAIIDRNSHERISKIIGTAARQGAHVILDGRDCAAPTGFEGGNWLGATIIDKAAPTMECIQSEIFGPVLSILRFESLRGAMAFEASLPYGNATSIFTSSGAAARFVSDQATSGMVGINVGVPVPREPFSFGGRKASKFGHGDITGMSAVEFWTDSKKVTSKWAEHSDRGWMS